MPFFRPRSVQNLVSNCRKISTTEYILLVATIIITSKLHRAFSESNSNRYLASRDVGSCFTKIDALSIAAKNKEVTSKVPIFRSAKILIEGVENNDGLRWGQVGTEELRPLPKGKLNPDGRYEVQFQEEGKHLRFVCEGCDVTSRKPIEIEILGPAPCGYYVDYLGDP